MNKKRFVTTVALAFIFPIFTVLIAEYIQMGSLLELLEFVVRKPGIIVFDIVLTTLFFSLTLFLFKTLWISAAVSGFVFYTLACIEYFKYSISGSHLVLSDFLMAGSLGDISGFADIHINFQLVAAFILLATTVFAAYKLKIKLSIRLARRLCSALLCVACAAVLVIPSNAMERTYQILELDTQPATNSFHLNERFENNGFLGFLYCDASEKISGRVREPDGYSMESVADLLEDADASDNSKEKPSVVFILSESFADLRELDRDIPRDIYASLDKAYAKGISGKIVMPTFGGYTVRTEFELLFGVPAYSLNNPEIPHYMLPRSKDRALTVADYYKSLGYITSYIHPFSETFYERNEVYSKYAFDYMYFSENMTVNTKLFKRYIDDYTVFEQIKYRLENDSRSSFIFATTMQNHQPYNEEDESVDELTYYLDGIKNSSDALYEFLCYLDDLNEEVILIYLGDHFPFFTPQGKIYEKLGVNDSNLHLLYFQNCLIFSNYSELDEDIFEQPFSAFYLPHIISNIAGVRKSAFINTILREKENTPIYSVSMPVKTNTVLDMLAYDRVLGESFSE